MERKFQAAEIVIEPAVEGCPVDYLPVSVLPGSESHLAFQVNVAGGKEPHVQIAIQSSDRHI